MKKIFFTLIAVMFAGSLCFAEQPAVKADEPTGKVESVQQPSAKVDETKYLQARLKKLLHFLGDGRRHIIRFWLLTIRVPRRLFM